MTTTISEWEPIETAPEGVRVLVCGSKRLDGPVVAHKANGEWLIETCSSHETIYPPEILDGATAATGRIRTMAHEMKLPDYEELKTTLREMPNTWVPALLAVLIQRSGVWRDLIGLQSFVAKAWERK